MRKDDPAANLDLVAICRQHGEMLSVLRTVRLAFRDDAPHVERVSALCDVDKIITQIAREQTPCLKKLSPI